MEETQFKKAVVEIQKLGVTKEEKKHMRESILSTHVLPQRSSHVLLRSPFIVLSFIRHNRLVDGGTRMVYSAASTAGKSFFFVKKVVKNIFSR